jgi:hypothetical protein
LKAPRLIARSFTSPPSGGLCRSVRKDRPETDRDLTKTPKPVHHPKSRNFLSLFKG